MRSLTVEEAAIRMGKAALRADYGGDNHVIFLESDVMALMNDDLPFDEAHSFTTMLACAMYVQGLPDGR